jgi:hypothetical protein
MAGGGSEHPFRSTEVINQKGQIVSPIALDELATARIKNPSGILSAQVGARRWGIVRIMPGSPEEASEDDTSAAGQDADILRSRSSAGHVKMKSVTGKREGQMPARAR